MEDAGHGSEATLSVEDGLRAAEATEFDAIVLDINFPGPSGFEMTERLRASGSDVPILLLTAREAERDVVRGLDAGADDYVTKPVSPEVLLARLRAITRRQDRDEGMAEEHGSRGILRFEDVEMDRLKRTLTKGGCRVRLTPTEFKVLEVLMLRPGVAVQRHEFFAEVWGMDFDPGTTNLAVHISHLRSKLESKGGRRIIKTIRPGAFVLASEDDPESGTD